MPSNLNAVIKPAFGTLGAAGLVLSAALVPRSALAQCANCPPGSIVENEPQCSGPDVVNGGCNSSPPVWGSMALGQTVCGTGWLANAQEYRDSDWHQFSLAATTAVSVTGAAEFEYQVAFVRAPCPAPMAYVETRGAACVPVTLNATLPAGTWWLFVAPAPTVPTQPFCGARYNITVTGAVVGACCLPSGVCQATGSTGCAAAGGVFRGEGTACGNCPQPAGQWGEQDDAGDRIDTAQVTMGGGALNAIRGTIGGPSDADIYAIQICNPGGFSAQTTSGPGTLADTQLFLFRPDGTGIAFNDDDPQGGLRSRLSSTFTSGLAAGVYYIAVSAYDTDPQDTSPADLWLDGPFATERAPDGPGAANPVASWDGTGNAGTYTITLTGTCFAAPAGWTEEAEAGDLVGSSQIIVGSGPLAAVSGAVGSGADADMYGISVCNPSGFSAETITGPGTLGDTQLFLFRPTGIGIAANDDDPQFTGGVRSRLSSTFTSGLPAGLYYLAVSGYDCDPASSSSQQLWLDTPFATERAPDGPGAASTLAAWSGSASTGSYVVRLTGACYGPPLCYPNCDASTNAPILTIADFGCFLNRFAAADPYANCDNSTTPPILNVADFACFLNRFAAGCN